MRTPNDRTEPRMHGCGFLIIVYILLMCLAAPLPTAASTACTDLPPSVLQVYYAKTVDEHEFHVTNDELKQEFSPEFLTIRHFGMLAVSNVLGIFDIEQRIIRTDHGLICGSPRLVRIGFGSTQRMVFLAQTAANDDCIRRHLLEHGAAHTRALNDTVIRFIDDQQTLLQQGMKALKQTPAPSEEVVINQWNVGLQLIVSAAQRQLVREILAASASVDEGSVLSDLANTCGGKMGRFDLK